MKRSRFKRNVWSKTLCLFCCSGRMETDQSAEIGRCFSRALSLKSFQAGSDGALLLVSSSYYFFGCDADAMEAWLNRHDLANVNKLTFFQMLLYESDNGSVVATVATLERAATQNKLWATLWCVLVFDSLLSKWNRSIYRRHHLLFLFRKRVKNRFWKERKKRLCAVRMQPDQSELSEEKEETGRQTDS